MLLNYHIRRLVLSSLCVGDLVRLVLSGARMKNVSDKTCRENQNTLFFFENRAVCEIMWKNIVERCRPQMITYYGAFALHAGYLGL